MPADAEPFDIPGVKFSHHGGHCSFHSFVRHYRLTDPLLARIARIIDEADTVQEASVEPAATGLDLICEGLRLICADDHDAVSVAETSNKGHGRRERRRLEASTRLAEHLDWPGVSQVCRIERWRSVPGKEEHEVAYAITSVPRSLANAATLLACNRGHWGIENRSHYVRDVTFGEDASQIRQGHAPQILASLRNGLITALRAEGVKNIAAALRKNALQVPQLLAKLGFVKK